MQCFLRNFPLMQTKIADEEVITMAITLTTLFKQLEIQSCCVLSHGNYKNMGNGSPRPKIYEIKN